MCNTNDSHITTQVGLGHSVNTRNVFPPVETSSPYQFAVDFNKLYAPWHGLISIGVCIFGITSNLLNIFVLLRPQLRTPTNVLLTLVAACDLLLMADYLTISIYQKFSAPNPCTHEFHDAVLFLCHANIGVTLYGISTWLTVALGALRCLILKTKGRYDSYKTAFTMIVVVIVGVILACIPNYLSHGIVYIPVQKMPCETIGNYDVPRVGPSRFSTAHGNQPLRIAYWVSGILFKIVPCILLTIFMIILIHVLAKSQKIRQKLHLKSCKKGPKSPPSNQIAQKGILCRTKSLLSEKLLNNDAGHRKCARSQSDCNLAYRVTMVLVGILFIFLLTQCPQGLFLILTAILPDNFRRLFYSNIGDISELMSLVNCSVNFVLYCAMSSQYRNACSEFLTVAYHSVSALFVKRCSPDRYSISIIDCDSCIEKHLKVVHHPSSEHSHISRQQNACNLSQHRAIVENNFHLPIVDRDGEHQNGTFNEWQSIVIESNKTRRFSSNPTSIKIAHYLTTPLKSVRNSLPNELASMDVYRATFEPSFEDHEQSVLL